MKLPAGRSVVSVGRCPRRGWSLIAAAAVPALELVRQLYLSAHQEATGRPYRTHSAPHHPHSNRKSTKAILAVTEASVTTPFR